MHRFRVKGNQGRITESPANISRKVRAAVQPLNSTLKGTIHWVSAPAKTAEIRLYDRLFKVENPSAEEGISKDYINPIHHLSSHKAYIEPSLADAGLQDRFNSFVKDIFCVGKAQRPEN